MTISKFGFPTTIHFGPSARKLVGDHLRELRLQRPIIVTDKGLAAQSIASHWEGEDEQGPAVADEEAIA